MSKAPSPCKQRGDFHRRNVTDNQKAAAAHAKQGEVDAERRHQAAADARAALTNGRDGHPAEETALRLSGMAEQSSYQAKKNQGV